MQMKVVILAGGLGTRPLGGDRRQAQADGRDRRPADPLAHHEASTPLTASTSSSSPSATRASMIKDYFLNYHYRSRSLTVHLATGAGHDPQRRRRRLGGPPARHRRGHADRRAGSSAWPTYIGPEPFMLTYGDGVGDIDLPALLDVPPPHGQARHGDRRAPAGPLRQMLRARRRPGRGVHREAADRRRLDQRRLLRARAGRPRLHRRRRPRPASASRSSAWPPTASWPPTSTRASGSAWTRCATSILLDRLWSEGNAPWKMWR